MLGGRKVSGLMLDLSGTVHIDDKLLPGVQEAVSKVRSLGIPIQFVTNTSKESLMSLGERVRKAGLQEVDNNAIFTSLTAAKELGPFIIFSLFLYLCYYSVLREELRPMLMLEESAKKEFTEVDTNNPNCVLVGLSPSSFHYEKLDQAFKLGNFIGIQLYLTIKL